ncbi:MAG: FAD binding domain-containing protein, partial [Acidobacteriota bacterium]
RLKLNFLSKDMEDSIRLENDSLILDAGLTVTDLMNSVVLSNFFPQIKGYLKLFGSHQIRNRATLGGNIVNASPAADLVNILLAMDSTLVIKDKEVREVALKDFYLGYKKLNKTEDELVVKIKFPVPEAGYFFNYEKVSRRVHLDIASVNSSIYLKAEGGFIKDINISAGGVAPVPLYLKETVSFLKGKEVTFENIHHAALTAEGEISPISDIRGSREYKRLLLRQLIFAHFQKFSPELIESPEMLLT